MSKHKGATVSVPNDWQAESDLHHLIEARKIRKDKKRHAAAKAHAAKKMKELQETRDNMHEELAEGEKKTERK